MIKSQLKKGYLIQNEKVLKLFRFIDFLGYKLFNFNRRFRGYDLNNKKILVCNTAHLGDVLLSLRFVELLKSKFNNVKIYFLCGSWSLALLVDNPYIDEIIIYDEVLLNRNRISKIKKIMINLIGFVKVLKKIREERIDIAFNLRAYFNTTNFLLLLSGIPIRVGYKTGGMGFLLTKTEEWIEGEHEIEHHLRLLKDFLKEDYHKYLSYPDMEYILKEEKLKYKIGINKYIVINIFSGEERKKINDNSLWIDLIKYFADFYDVYLIGTSDIKEIIEKGIVSKINSNRVYNIAGKTNLYDVFYLVKNAEFVVSVDSLISHILGIYNKKSLVIFHGNNDFNQWRPLSENIMIYRKQLSCSPCFFKISCNDECFQIKFDEIKDLLK
ncbi:MAG: glycosyltransferase family 9 protein [Elusimicrobiota bacterium]